MILRGGLIIEVSGRAMRVLIEQLQPERANYWKTMTSKGMYYDAIARRESIWLEPLGVRISNQVYRNHDVKKKIRHARVLEFLDSSTVHPEETYNGIKDFASLFDEGSRAIVYHPGTDTLSDWFVSGGKLSFEWKNMDSVF